MGLRRQPIAGFSQKGCTIDGCAVISCVISRCMQTMAVGPRAWPEVFQELLLQEVLIGHTYALNPCSDATARKPVKR